MRCCVGAAADLLHGHDSPSSIMISPQVRCDSQVNPSTGRDWPCLDRRGDQRGKEQVRPPRGRRPDRKRRRRGLSSPPLVNPPRSREGSSARPDRFNTGWKLECRRPVVHSMRGKVASFIRRHGDEALAGSITALRSLRSSTSTDPWTPGSQPVNSVPSHRTLGFDSRAVSRFPVPVDSGCRCHSGLALHESGSDRVAGETHAGGRLAGRVPALIEELERWEGNVFTRIDRIKGQGSIP